VCLRVCLEAGGVVCLGVWWCGGVIYVHLLSGGTTMSMVLMHIYTPIHVRRRHLHRPPALSGGMGARAAPLNDAPHAGWRGQLSAASRRGGARVV
jgi:hypothetical protein